MAAALALVIDDNALNRQLVSFLLTSAGFEVCCAGDAAQALDLLRSLRPELILMDVQLPGMDGLALTRMIKADPAQRDVTIVAVTAFAMRGDEQKALDAGCDGYIAKPIDTASFVRTLTNCMAARAALSGRLPNTRPALLH